MMTKILTNIIMLLSHILYKRTKHDIMYIRNPDNKHYLLYSEKPNVYQRMEEF